MATETFGFQSHGTPRVLDVCTFCPACATYVSVLCTTCATYVDIFSLERVPPMCIHTTRLVPPMCPYFAPRALPVRPYFAPCVCHLCVHTLPNLRHPYVHILPNICATYVSILCPVLVLLKADLGPWERDPGLVQDTPPRSPSPMGSSTGALQEPLSGSPSGRLSLCAGMYVLRNVRHWSSTLEALIDVMILSSKTKIRRSTSLAEASVLRADHGPRGVLRRCSAQRTQSAAPPCGHQRRVRSLVRPL